MRRALAGGVIALIAVLVTQHDAAPAQVDTPPAGYQLWPRPIDGHTPCYVNVGPTSYVWCADGYRTES